MAQFFAGAAGGAALNCHQEASLDAPVAAHIPDIQRIDQIII